MTRNEIIENFRIKAVITKPNIDMLDIDIYKELEEMRLVEIQYELGGKRILSVKRKKLFEIKYMNKF